MTDQTTTTHGDHHGYCDKCGYKRSIRDGYCDNCRPDTDATPDNIRQQIKRGERVITEGDPVPTPPFGGNTQPVPHNTDAQRLERELSEARAEIKVLRNAIEETREQLFICLPEHRHDEWTRFFEPHHLAGMAVATLDHIAESNAQAVEQAQTDAAKVRQAAIAAEVAHDALQQDVIYIVSMLSELDDIVHMGTQEEIGGALELVRLMIRRTLRDNPATTPPDDVDEVPF